ncbi:TPA: hypothetical protein ACKFM7_005414 [Burkholderia contaminans]|uniref:hypothetical protein n=1 Tax=Burkholderia contaminans TaxID=488447 RepID=UPI001CF13FFE|nr:hypothetical protein [Burkholderia contaminans]MCA7917673.1 hypothetical protein [Burkholderia contaminans]
MLFALHRAAISRYDLLFGRIRLGTLALPRALCRASGIRYLRAAAKHHSNRYFARTRG